MDSDTLQEAAPAPALQALRLSSRDADEQASRFALLDQRYEQLSCGPFSGSLLCLTLGKVTLFRETLEQSVQQTGVAPLHCLTIAAACELSDDAYGAARLGTRRGLSRVAWECESRS